MTVNNAKGPSPEQQPVYTDSYFNLARKIVRDHGDKQVTYAVFMRRPVTPSAKIGNRLAGGNGWQPKSRD